MNLKFDSASELVKKYSTTHRMVKAKSCEIIDVIRKNNNPEDKFETVLFLPENENRYNEGGLRTKGYFKINEILLKKTLPLELGEEYFLNPLITVITVVYNGEKFIEETILSVINQTYNNVEYIIIDGGSTDSTLDIIRKYEHAIDYWVSEKDSCMYDAINKGIKLSLGEYIFCLNSDDKYYDENVLYSLIDSNRVIGAECVYGDIVKLLENKDERQRKTFEIDFDQLLMSEHCTFFPQPALMLSKNIYKKIGLYDLRYKYASDFEFNLRVLKEGFRLNYTRKPITYFRVHALSITSSGKLREDRLNILKDFKLFERNFFVRSFYYYYNWLRYKLINLL